MQGSGKKILQAIVLNSQQPVEQQSSRKIVRKQQESNTSKSRKNKKNIENHSPNHNHKTVSTKKKIRSPLYKKKHNQKTFSNYVMDLVLRYLKETLNPEYDKIWVILEGIVLAKNEELIKTVLNLIKEFEENKKISVEPNTNLALLHFAIRFNSLELVKALLSYGFDVNVKDNLGLTPLHYAVNDSNLRAVEFLISKGADLSAQDKSGKTPLQLAKELEIKRDYSLYERKEIVALLANAHSNKQEAISFSKYDKPQDLQFKSQYAIDLVTSYMNKQADIIDKSGNTIISYKQEVGSLMDAYLVEAKFLQNEMIGNEACSQLMVGNISSTPISSSEIQVFDVSSPAIDDDILEGNSTIQDINQAGIDSQQETGTTNNIIASNKTSPMKKAMYATMIASPFIAVGIYAAVALSAGIVEFNPIIAAGIFVGVATLAVMCFVIAKVCEKVSKEKDNDPNISTCTAFKNALTLECFRSSETAIPDPVYVN
ncbi:ankyrin repeat domain-containing protein [Candidatus Mesenet endosymbiont of Phosphuga atrata]|uniref:ankyrin repeat domain-containing protein n=1 Tax=Candidatus Mesenet endosymbiont of Phosphuga atrata TaxID=3066221 RepID=UPI0030D59424